MPNNNDEGFNSQMPINNMNNITNIDLPQTNNVNSINMPQMDNSLPQQTNIQPEMNVQQNPAQPQTQPTDNSVSAKMLPLCIVSAAVIFAALYTTVNINSLIIVAIPAYIYLGAIIFAIIDKKKSEFPLALMIGGILTAAISFVISMVEEEAMDLWTYYAIGCAISGFVGMILANIVTKLLTGIKEIKALETIFYVAIIALTLAGPFLAYKKWPTEFNRIVLYKQTEVVAETYEEFVTKTLKGRYNIDFTCDFENAGKYKTEKKELMYKTYCTDTNKNKTLVTTIAYNEGAIQYSVQDDYLEVLYLNDVKKAISSKIKLIGATNITILLYPEKNCSFVGDCAPCDEYYEIYSTENNTEHRYSVSRELNLSKYIGLTDEEFVDKYLNQNKYKYIISVKGTFGTHNVDYNNYVNQILTVLNESGYKNTYGYEISFSNYKEEHYDTKIYEVKGKTNNEQVFKDPVVQTIK